MTNTHTLKSLAEIPETEISSTNALYFNSKDKEDACKRSQSDASFFMSPNNRIFKQCGKISEHSMVYWNLPEAVEASTEESKGDEDIGADPNVPLQSTACLPHETEELPTISDPAEIHIHRIRFGDGSSSTPSGPPSPSITSVNSPLSVLEVQNSDAKLDRNITSLLDDSNDYTHFTVQMRQTSRYSHFTANSADFTERVLSSSVASDRHKRDKNAHSVKGFCTRYSDSGPNVPPTEDPGGGEMFSHLGFFDILRKNLLDPPKELRTFKAYHRYVACQNGQSLDNDCEILNACNQLMTEAHEMSDTQAVNMVCDLFRKCGLVQALVARLTGPLDDPTENNAVNGREVSTHPKIITEVPELENQERSAISGFSKIPAYQNTIDREQFETAGFKIREQEMKIRSIRLLRQLLSCESLDRWLNKSVKSISQSVEKATDEELPFQPTNNVVCSGRTERRLNTFLSREADVDVVVHRMVSGCWHHRQDVNLYREYISLMEPLLNQTEELCENFVHCGGLNNLVYACQSDDITTLRYAALCLVNLATFGGTGGQGVMERDVIMWLFRLAFHSDDVIKYYGCLTSIVLLINRKLAPAVLKTGTLALIEPFVQSHSPDVFAREQLVLGFSRTCGPLDAPLNSGRSPICSKCHMKTSRTWMECLLPALSSEIPEARVFAAFHIATEATLHSDEGHIEVIKSLHLTDKLVQAACSRNVWESRLGLFTLTLLGKDMPLTPHVPLWATEDVKRWLEHNKLGQLVELFESNRIDGELLLSLGEAELEQDLGITNKIVRRTFLRALRTLKTAADYSSLDSTDLAGWLRAASESSSTDHTERTSHTLVHQYHSPTRSYFSCGNPFTDLVQYTYNLLSAGVDRTGLPLLTETMLVQDCHISNGYHRARILEAVKASKRIADDSHVDQSSPCPLPHHQRSIDAFISYRRSSGSQLASLLKVHLCSRGYRVFLDIDRLKAGRFHLSLLRSISASFNFILVLTPDALDRCIDDVNNEDWVHREIVWALRSECNVIPIFSSFVRPPADILPEDIRTVLEFNGVHWIHEYQEACIDKLEEFLKLPP